MEHGKSTNKAVVHVSGTLLRRVWYGKELQGCIIVRPGGEDRDTEGYVVNQVHFDGATDLVFSARPRQASEKGLLAGGEPGFEGTLPGFDGSVMVYIEAEERDVHVQPRAGDDFMPLASFRHVSHKFGVPRINPMLLDGC